MKQKSKTLPTAEIINKFTTYNAEMNAAMNKGDFNLANEYIEKMAQETTHTNSVYSLSN